MIKVILLLVGNVSFNAAANLLMKIGMKRTEGVNLASVNGAIHGLVLNPALITGVFSYAISLGFYIFALKKLNLSIAYPVSVSAAIVLVTIASSIWLGESISANHIIGSIIIMFGIFILTR